MWRPEAPRYGTTFVSVSLGGAMRVTKKAPPALTGGALGAHTQSVVDYSTVSIW